MCEMATALNSQGRGAKRLSGCNTGGARPTGAQSHGQDGDPDLRAADCHPSCQTAGTLRPAHCASSELQGLRGPGESLALEQRLTWDLGPRQSLGWASVSPALIWVFSPAPGTRRLRGGAVQAKGEQPFAVGMGRQLDRDAQGQASRDRQASLTRSA